MKRLLQPPPFLDEDQQRLARILYVILGALLAAAGILLVLFWTAGRYWPGITGMLVGIGVGLAAVAMVRAGRLQLAGLTTLLALTGVVTYLVVAGGGLHDVALMAFPVILVAAALLVTRRLFITLSLFIVLVTSIIGAAEMTGWLINPFSATTSLNDVASVVIVLALTALTARLLADNLTFSLERLRHELAERRRTEEAYHTVVENSMEGLAIFQDQRLAFTNPAFRALIGYSEAELAAMPLRALLGLVYPADRRALAEALRAATTSVQRHESRFVRKDGVVRWLEGTVTPVTYRDAPALQAAFVDISERRQVADVLHSGDERFRALVQNSSDAITLLSPDGTVLYDSPAITRVLGYGPAERLGTNAFAAVHPDDLLAVRATFAQLFGKPNGAAAAELRLQHKDGSWRWVELVGSNLLHVPGVQAMVANYRDITRRKTAEAELRDTEARYRALVEQLPAIVFLIEFGDPSRLVYISPQGETLFGLTAEKWNHDPDGWLQIVHPDDRPTALAAARRILETGEAVEFEFRATTLAGREAWYDSQWAILPDASGQPHYAQGLLYDITERRRAEEDLRRSEAHNRALLSAIPDLLFQMGANGRFTGFQASRSGGAPAVPPAAFVGKTVSEVLGPEIGAQTEKAIQLALSTGEVQTFEYTLSGADGAQEFEARVTPSDSGEVLALARDITARKQAERSLRQLLARLEVLHDIDRAILTARSPEATAQAALDSLRAMVGSLRASVSVFDFTRGEVHLLALSVDRPTQVPGGARYPLPAYGLRAVEALRLKQPYIIEDTRLETEQTAEDEQIAREGVRAWLSVPMLYQSELIGAVNLGFAQAGRPASDLIQVAQEVATQIAIAMQQAQLFEQTSDALIREQRLNEIARVITGALDLPTVLESVVRLSTQLVDAEAGTLGLLSADGQSLTDVYDIGVAPALQNQTLGRGRGVMWDVITTGRASMVPDYAAHPGALPEWVAFGMQAYLGIPVAAGDTLLGVLGIARLTPDKPFNDRDRLLLESVGRQAGIAIQNARLYRQAQQQAEQLSVLNDIGRVVSSKLDLEAVLEQIYQQVRRIMPVDAFAVSLYDPSTQIVSYPLVYDEGRRYAQPTQEALDEGTYLHRAVSAAQPFLINRDLAELQAAQARLAENGVGNISRASASLMFVPMLVGSQVIGVISAQSYELSAYTAEHLRLLQGVAQQAGIALQNAQLFQQAQQQAGQLSVLNEIGRIVSAQLDLQAVLEQIHQQLRRVLAIDSFFVSLFDPATQLVTYPLVYDNGQRYEQAPARLDPNRHLALYTAITTGEPELTLRTAERIQEAAAGLATGGLGDYSQPSASLMFAPMQVGSQIIGVISAQSYQLDAYTRDDLRLLQGMAQQAGIAIQNAQLFEARQRQVEELSVLHAVAVAAAESANEDELLQRAVRTLSQSLFPDVFGVVLLDPAAGVLYAHPATQGVGDEVRHMRTPLGEGVIGGVAARGQPRRIPDVSQAAEYIPALPGIRSELAVPLKVGDRVLGVFDVESTHPDAFSADDERLLVTVAGQVATALERLRAQSALQRSLARMEILHDIDTAILVAQSPEATAQAALERVRTLVGAQRVSATLFDFSTEQAYLLAVSSAGPTQFPAGARMSFDVFGRYTVEALQRRQPFIIEDVNTQEMAEEDRQLAAEGVLSFVFIPLEYQSELIGSLNLGLPHVGRAAPELVEIAQEVAAQLAIAIQTARLFTQTSEALLREQRLNEVVRTISGSLNLPVVLQNVMRLAVEIITADAGSLDLLADDRQSITDAYSVNVPAHLTGQTLPRGRGVIWQVVDSGHAVMLTNYQQLPEALPEWKAFGVQTFLGAPISSGAQVLGSLTLFSLDPQRSFSARDLSLVESIGRQAGVAIQNARLFEATQQRNRETTALLASAEAISASLEIEGALRAVAEQAVTLMQANGSRVHLLEPDEVTLRCVIAREQEAEQIMAIQLKVGQGFTGRVAQTGQPMRVLSPDTQGIGLPVPGTPNEPECLALVPLKWQERVTGVMTVIRDGHARPFTEAELRVLSGLAAHASSAIANARLFEAARQELAERERAQAQLRVSDEILKRVASLVLVADPDGRVTYASESFRSVLGVEPGQLLGEGWWQYRGEAMASEREAITREARGLDPLRAPQYENTVTDTAGRTHWILWQDVLGPGGTIIGVGHDITERKKSEEQLREAELRFRTLVEHIPAITYIVNLDRPMKTLYVSPQVEQVLGFTPAEWANDEIWSRQLHPEDRERVLAEDQHAHESGEPFAQEYRVIGKDGRVVWLHDESRWVRDDSGRPMFAQGIEFDITERKRAEEQLREAELRFRTLVEQSPAIIYIVPPSADLRPLYVSPQIEPVLGFTPEEWLADPGLWGKLLHPDDREAVLAHELHTRRTVQPFSMEYRIFRKDGQVVWLHDEARWVVDESGKPLFAQGIEFDISDRKRAEADIARQLREIQALYQISQLLAGTLALEEILQKIAEAAARVMQRADRVVMHLLDGSGKVLQPVALAGPEQGNLKRRVNFHWGQGLAGLAIATGQTLNVPDAPKDPRYVPIENHIGRVHSLAVAPVQVGDKRLGTLSVHSHAVGAFTAEDERLLTTLAVQAGLAIEKARLFEAERRRAEEAEALQQVTRTLINRRRLRELLQDAVDAMALIAKYRYIVLNLRERDTLVPVAWKGYNPDDLQPISVNQGITGRVARSGVPIFVEDTDRDPDALDVGPHGTSLIGVPLALSDRLLGVLTVEAPPELPLDQTDLNWLMNIGRQISTAVENARLNTDLETALQQEKAARSQLVQSEKLASMGKLVASVAHELNNPLQAIQNALFLVQQEVGLSEQTRADLEVAATETHRMADLIARLRDTYRPTTSEQFQPESLNAVVEDVQRLIATHLRHSHITVEYRPDANLPPVSAIRDQLKQAVLNLCINAVEAMPDGGQLTIDSRYAPEVDEVCLSITDTGMGIDPADLPNVFDPFFTTKASGTGLGLAITHDIARRHGGRLEVTSQLGQGTTFILCLPVGGPLAGTGILHPR